MTKYFGNIKSLLPSASNFKPIIQRINLFLAPIIKKYKRFKKELLTTKIILRLSSFV